MTVSRTCATCLLSLLVLHPLLRYIHCHRYVNDTLNAQHNHWIPERDEDLVGFVLNKKKRSAKESRFLKFDYLSQNINVGLEFFVPALQIPVEKAGDGIDIPSLLKKGLPQITVNIGALILVAVVVITTLLAHLFLNYKPLVIAEMLKNIASGFKRFKK